MESDRSLCQAGTPKGEADLLLLVRIVNFPQLWDAYGDPLRSELNNVVSQQVEALSLRRLPHAVPGEYVFVHKSFDGVDAQDLLCEKINACLSFGPIVCDEAEAYLQVDTAVIRRIENGLSNEMATAGLTVLPFHALHNERLRRRKAYRSYMLSALSVYSQLTARRICLAFEPVVPNGSEPDPIYWKSSLRRLLDSDFYLHVDCKEHMMALESLGLTERLDRSALTTILDLLSDRDQVRIGYRVSTISLKFSGWWRLFFRDLKNRPDIAARLIIEVCEDRVMGRDEEAITLLRTLRILGCKIAVVDVGLRDSTFDLLARLKPDFISINIKGLREQEGRFSQSSENTYHGLMQFCSQLRTCVMTQ